LLIYLVYNQLNKNGVKLINPFLLNDWLDKKILHFTVPAALSGFLILGLAMGANTILFTVEDGLYQVALLALVLNFKQIMLAFPNLLNRVLFIIFNNLYGIGEKTTYTKYFYTNLYGSVVLNFLFILIVLFLSGLIIQSVYGNKYGKIDALILLVSVWALLETIFQALYQNIQVYGKMWESLFLIVFPANMIAFWIVYVFSHEYGAQAFILGYLIATLYSIIPTLYLNKKIRASTMYAVENV